MEQESISSIISSSSDAFMSTNGVISAIFNSHMQKYERAEKYLETAILKKGAASDEDIEIAARLYAIPMLRKKI